MFATISNIMRVEDLRRKILFTFLMLIVFRIGTFTPVPNVDAKNQLCGSGKRIWHL